MSLNDSQKLDILWKKLNFGKAETDVLGKEGYNEVIPSPVPTYSKDVWQEAELIPIPPTLGVGLTDITEYLTVQCTSDSSVSGNKTWLTTTIAGDPLSIVGDWVDTTFSPEYLVEVYDADPSNGGSLLNRATPDEEWNFDYIAGVLYFANNIPSGLNQVWIRAFRYIGGKGVGSTSNSSRIQDTDDDTYVEVGTDNNVEIVSGGGNIILDGTATAATGNDLIFVSEVGKNISLDGMLFPEEDGDAGRFLSTDGNGTLSWAEASGAQNEPRIFITDAFATGTGTIEADVDPITGLVTNITGDTNLITVVVKAEIPSVGFKPTATIEGVSVTNFQLVDGLWEGSAEVSADNNIEVVNGDGQTASATFTLGDKAVVSKLEFIAPIYTPYGGTSRIRGGVTVQIVLRSSKELLGATIVYDNTNNDDALQTQTFLLSSGILVNGEYEYFISATTNTISDTNGTDRSITVNVLDVDNYVSDNFNSVTINGSSVDEVTTIINDNVSPSATIDTITYINNQGALKQSTVPEVATFSVTYQNTDSVLFSTPNDQITVSGETDLGELNKTATFSSGGIGQYNYDSFNNLIATLTREANGLESTVGATIRIADAEPTVQIQKASRLISSPLGEESEIVLNFDQILTKGVLSLDASVGTWTGAWSGSGEVTSSSRPLSISDIDSKGNAIFSNLSGLTNLAGKPVVTNNISSGDENYVVGGFVEREIIFNIADYSKSIGTTVSDTSKLIVTDVDGVIDKSAPLTFRNSLVEGDDLNNFLTTSTLNFSSSFTVADSDTDPISPDNQGGFVFILDRLAIENNTTSFRIKIEESI